MTCSDDPCCNWPCNVDPCGVGNFGDDPLSDYPHEYGLSIDGLCRVGSFSDGSCFYGLLCCIGGSEGADLLMLCSFV